MSGKSCESFRAAAAAAAPPHDLALAALYDRKRDHKSVRVLTVIIYVFCVSLAAIMLSLYYVFFWEPKDQRKVQRTVDRTTPIMPTCFMPLTGGLNTTVSNAPPAPSLATITDDVTDADLTSSNVSDVTYYNTTRTPSDVNATVAVDTSSSDYNETDST